MRSRPNTWGESYGGLVSAGVSVWGRPAILTQCRCVCVARWYEGPSSAAPQGGSSSRKTALEETEGEELSYPQMAVLSELIGNVIGASEATVVFSPPACVIVGSAAACTDTAVAVPSLTVAAGK